ncbi:MULTISPECIES: MobP2 family relaxase [Aerococcus]|uniref:MobP2 family relaxase n=5 Tax=Aerococcaceae TaxID=186827 RepID=A0A1E9PJ20_9LACT|nr:MULTISPECIES: MobP2 family relaxase [Aerococcus]RAV78372.1 hypothetical protein DBT54_07375 [Aerococcus loyolae]MBU5610972.1 hypothetical protein [Aerococcus urinae]MCY3065801.1 relaxase MobL [Aerococcus mictus]MCY3074141.1 relaxase MobL [Aerococcus mictus]MCY3075846.1 relaxase MobL [Aerococcus mictus]
MGSPGIILSGKFSLPNSGESYGGYADYLTRTEALERDKNSEERRKSEAKQIIDYHRMLRDPDIDKKDKDFGRYVYYTTRKYALDQKNKKNEKGEKILSGVFSDKLDQMTMKDKREFSKVLTEAQEKGSVMWEDVISFDNTYLEENGLYNSTTGELDEDRLQKATRKMMKKFAKLEDLHEPRWMASIHRNTDNIHIHLATVELEPSRKQVVVDNKKQPRGKRKQSSLDKMKTEFGTELLQMSELFYQVTDQRQKAVDDIRKYLEKRYEKDIYTQTIDYLDHIEGNDWHKKVKRNHVSYKKLDGEGKYRIDQVVKKVANEDETFRNDLEEYEQMIQLNNDIFKKMYGQKYDKKEEYLSTRTAELKERLGNRTLKELGKMKEERLQNSNNKQKEVKKDIWKDIKENRLPQEEIINKYKSSEPNVSSKQLKKIKSSYDNKKEKNQGVKDDKNGTSYSYKKSRYRSYTGVEKDLWVAGKKSERELSNALKRTMYQEKQRAMQSYQEMMADVERA